MDVKDVVNNHCISLRRNTPWEQHLQVTVWAASDCKKCLNSEVWLLGRCFFLFYPCWWQRACAAADLQRAAAEGSWSWCWERRRAGQLTLAPHSNISLSAFQTQHTWLAARKEYQIAGFTPTHVHTNTHTLPPHTQQVSKPCFVILKYQQQPLIRVIIPVHTYDQIPRFIMHGCINVFSLHTYMHSLMVATGCLHLLPQRADVCMGHV